MYVSVGTLIIQRNVYKTYILKLLQVFPIQHIRIPSISRRNIHVTAMRSNWKIENIYHSEFACFPFDGFR